MGAASLVASELKSEDELISFLSSTKGRKWIPLEELNPSSKDLISFYLEKGNLVGYRQPEEDGLVFLGHSCLGVFDADDVQIIDKNGNVTEFGDSLNPEIKDSLLTLVSR